MDEVKEDLSNCTSIIIDGGVTFEGTVEMFKETYFSNPTKSLVLAYAKKCTSLGGLGTTDVVFKKD